MSRLMLICSSSQHSSDPLDRSVITLYQGGKETPATKTEAKGLERAAVWDPEHIQDRLRDHYMGRLNKWVKLLRI